MSHSGSAPMQKQPTNYSFSEGKRKTMKKEGFLAKLGPTTQMCREKVWPNVASGKVDSNSIG